MTRVPTMIALMSVVFAATQASAVESIAPASDEQTSSARTNHCLHEEADVCGPSGFVQ